MMSRTVGENAEVWVPACPAPSPRDLGQVGYWASVSPTERTILDHLQGSDSQTARTGDGTGDVFI